MTREESLESLKAQVEQMASFHIKPPKGYYYSSLAHFVQENGKLYSGHVTYTKEEEKLLDRLVGVNGKSIQKACYRNAVLLAITAYHLGVADKVSYMEGYAIPSNLGIAFEHAFITINDKVFDPTWDDQEKAVYFGVPFSVGQLLLANASSLPLPPQREVGR